VCAAVGLARARFVCEQQGGSQLRGIRAGAEDTGYVCGGCQAAGVG
jgi:hypothetical protein